MFTAALLAARSRLCFFHVPAWTGTTWIDRAAGADTCWECRRLREDAEDRLCRQCQERPRLYGESRCTECLTPAPAPAPTLTFAQVRDSAARAGLVTSRLVTPRTAQIPSATTPGVEYTVWIQDGGTWGACTCEDGGAHCWHVPAALGLYHAAHAPRPALYSEAPEDSPYLLEVA